MAEACFLKVLVTFQAQLKKIKVQFLAIKPAHNIFYFVNSRVVQTSNFSCTELCNFFGLTQMI